MHTIYAAVLLSATMVFGLALRRTFWWATLWMARRYYLPSRPIAFGTARSVPRILGSGTNGDLFPASSQTPEP